MSKGPIKSLSTIPLENPAIIFYEGSLAALEGDLEDA